MFLTAKRWFPVAAAVALVAMTLGGGLAVAQQSTKDDALLAKLTESKIPLMAEAVGNMYLRDSPPYVVAAWYSRGDQIGIVKAGQVFQILDYKAIYTPFDTQDWLKVEFEDATQLKKVGWIYYGGADYVKATAEK